ncbi:MAG: sugar phosphate nucleotidyltransferase, partial [Candidatus ainarchaeum sp.]|nr:sugar phosphate nucleotidyltransferase [Candidatus ainarchaeum sp.]
MKGTFAIVLCGGKGLRMRPLTLETPKSLLKIGENTILEYVLRNLEKNGIKKAFLTVGYLKEKIIKYMGNESKGVEIEYIKEEEEQNTAGSILPLKDGIKKDFIVMMGDQITNINLRKMMEFHKKEGG